MIKGANLDKKEPSQPWDITPYCHIRIDKDGRWCHNGAEIIHRKIYLFFNQLLKRDNEGRYLIEDDKQRCYLEVDDVPFVVINLEHFSSPPAIIITLNDETTESLRPDTIRVARDNVLYCQVKKRKFEARFSRKSYYKLTKYIDFDQKEKKFFLHLDNKKYYLPSP